MLASANIPLMERFGYCVDAVVEALRQIGDETRAAEIDRERRHICESASLAAQAKGAFYGSLVHDLLLITLVIDLDKEFRADVDPYRRALADMLDLKAPSA